MCNIEYKKSIIESTLASAKLYYDDRLKTNATTTTSTSANNNNNNNVNNQQQQTTTNSTLTSLRKRLSSSSLSRKKKDKKQQQQQTELKIKEENEPSAMTSLDTLPDRSESLLNQDIDEDNGDDDSLDDVTEMNENCEGNICLTDLSKSSSELATSLINKIDRKVLWLDRLWQDLNRQALTYDSMLANFYQSLLLLNKSFDLVAQKINENESLVAKINTLSTSEFDAEKLAAELEKIKNLQLRLSSYQPLLDEMSTQHANVNQELLKCASAFANKPNTSVSTKFDDLNLRWSHLQNQLQEKYLHLYSLIESSGANIFLRLADSVQPPWQRGVSSQNKVPYYIKYYKTLNFHLLVVIFFLLFSSL